MYMLRQIGRQTTDQKFPPVMVRAWRKEVSIIGVPTVAFSHAGGGSISTVSRAVALIGFVGVAEFLFWDEFGVRFNFIAVDYLIYTVEVVGNIRESYPLPALFAGLAACGVVIALEILSIPWYINVLAWRNAVAVSGGVIAVGRTSADLPYDWGTPSLQVRRRDSRSLYLGFAFGRDVNSQQTVTYYFPIWPLLIPGACLVAVSCWRNRSRTRSARARSCTCLSRAWRRHRRRA